MAKPTGLGETQTQSPFMREFLCFLGFYVFICKMGMKSNTSPALVWAMLEDTHQVLKNVLGVSAQNVFTTVTVISIEK